MAMPLNLHALCEPISYECKSISIRRAGYDSRPWVLRFLVQLRSAATLMMPVHDRIGFTLVFPPFAVLGVYISRHSDAVYNLLIRSYEYVRHIYVSVVALSVSA
jgi:hypothetical protein